MSEPATKDDVAEAFDCERLTAVMQAGFARIEQRIDEFIARFDRQAARHDRILKFLERYK